jgi:hypothetical protein
LLTTAATLRVQRATNGQRVDTKTGKTIQSAPVVPYIRMGRKIAYDVKDIEAYINAHRVQPGNGGSAA